MNTHYLKKFRKLYQFHYDTEKKDWVVFNHKTKRVKYYDSIYSFIRNYLPYFSYCQYIERKFERNKRLEYYKELSKIKV